MRGDELGSFEQDMSEHDFRLGDELRGERATLGKSLLDVHRDLRIKASYISAIEDMDLSVFPNPSFVPGYVRAYARYLQLDPDMVYRRFCRESGFARPKDLALQPKAGAAAPAEAGSFQTRFPLAEVGSGIPSIPFSAIGSVLVLLVLVAGLGYGGWTVLQNIQRVQFAPVDDLPLALSEVEPLEAPEVADANEVVLTELAKPVASTALAELYRQQEVEVPILQPRDGPIAALDPDRLTPLAARRAEVVVVGFDDPSNILTGVNGQGIGYFQRNPATRYVPGALKPTAPPNPCNNFIRQWNKALIKTPPTKLEAVTAKFLRKFAQHNCRAVIGGIDGTFPITMDSYQPHEQP